MNLRACFPQVTITTRSKLILNFFDCLSFVFRKVGCCESIICRSVTSDQIGETQMSITERFSKAFVKSLFRAGYILAIVLVWQVSIPPLMGQFGSNLQYFSQVGVNGGSTTFFVINNPGTTETITVDAQLYFPDGTPLADGQVELGPGATETIAFGDPQAALTSGWAELKSDGAFIATEFFQLSIGGQLKPRVGVLPSVASDEIRFLGFVNPQFKSGLAVTNPSSTEESEITIRAKDKAGQEPVPEKTLTLAPLHSEAGFLNEEKFLGPALINYEGVVEITVNSPAVAAVFLIQEAGTADVATVSVLTQSHIITTETNTALGIGALVSNTGGFFNTATGAGALFSNTESSFNTATGAGALFSNTESSFNTATGADALFSNTEGSSNTASGADALFSNTTGSFNTASGFEALGSNTTGSSNTASGDGALVFNTTGSSNTASGVGALASNTTGSFNTAIGGGASVSTGNLTNATAIGANAIVDASNKILLGDANISVIEAQVGLTVVSDKTKKENFRPVDGEEVLSKLRSLEIPSWNFIGQDPEKFRHYGPMAQDFFAAFGKDGVGTIGTPTTINTSDLTGILMIAVQRLEERNVELKARFEELERAIKKMH